MDALKLLTQARAENVRYIKLGAGGGWEHASFAKGRIYWGSEIDPAGAVLSEDWPAARAHYLAAGLRPGTITSYIREMRDFSSADLEILWITFARGQMWWTFANGPVRRSDIGEGNGALFRETVDGWHNMDVEGRPLFMADLSTSLTKVSAYQQCICTVGAGAYLLRKLRAEPDPLLIAANAANDALATAILPLIQQLHQDDFELFTDLLFTAMGWRRVSALGGTMKDIDLVLELPATGERASVQVKSSANQRMLDACAATFAAGGVGRAIYFVCHTASSNLTAPVDSHVRLLAGNALARAAIDHGVSNWLLRRAG